LQANFDEVAQKLTFEIFGTSDGRKTIIEGPIILSETPPPEPIYEDDPNLPVGQQKQVDTAHYGAKTSFTRTVTRDGEILIKETVISNYIPWPARFLRGTKI
jgi:vancomycin resistance protein YoaR